MGHQPRSTPLSAEEKATRRAVALTVAEAGKVPPFSTANITPEIGDRFRLLDGTIGEVIAEVTEDGVLAGAIPKVTALPTRRRTPDHPVVTITISGAPSSGKSVIAHLIRNALAYEGISASGPEGLRSVLWRRGVQDLVARGIRVVLQSEETDNA